MIPLSHYKDKLIAVFGLGKAGNATIAALLAGGAKVFAWDDSEKGVAAAKAQFAGAGDALTFSAPDQWNFHDISFLALSPGVPLTHPKPHPAVVLAGAQGCPVLGDIELLYQACPQARYIAITGTNGKSTTTTLIGHILKEAGQKVQVGGNLGTPALALEPLGAEGVYVLELSSYQLDLLQHARFQTACLLNITPDHLDRHGDMERYAKAKLRIFDYQHGFDAAVVAIDDAYTEHAHHLLSQRPFGTLVAASARRELPKGVSAVNGVLVDRLFSPDPYKIDLNPISTLTGRHNWQNAAVAYGALRSYGLSSRQIENGLKSYPGLKHRLELVKTAGGVRFINDSKATNAEATENALAPYENIYWILGGKAKEGGIAALKKYFPKVAHAFLIGEAAESFAQTLDGKVAYTHCGTLARAVEEASARALAEKKPGAVVLLSPACASFDQWKNFEERGDAFRAMVTGLVERVA